MKRRLPSLMACGLIALGLAAGALAYFTVTGTGSAAGGVSTLSAPGSPAASASGNNVNVTWTASTINGSVAATSYTVERYDGSGTDLGAASCSPVPSSAGNPNAFGSFTCTDSAGAGTFEYKITAHYDSSWTASTGFTNTATVQSTTSVSVAAPATDGRSIAIAPGSIAATLSGATSSAGGTITFKVFGPQGSAPITCTSGGTTVGTAAVSGNNTYYPSAGYTPGANGTYWWYASYSGDSGNTASASACGSGMPSTVVSTATPTITATGPASDTPGTAIAASAISSALSGATGGAGGTITFKVFGPQASAPTTCTSGGTQVGTAVTVSGNNTYHPTAGYTPSANGTYWWYASYSGDANDNAANSGCGSGMSSTVVANATTTTATGPANGTAGSPIFASSISSALSGATSGAGGTITFTVFGPQSNAPTTCTSGGTQVGTPVTVSGNATYHPSTSFTPDAAGTYWWYASYSGDTNNNPSSSACGSGMSSTVVAPAMTFMFASGPSSDTPGTEIAPGSISAFLFGATSSAGGTITFTVFGPQSSAPTTCTTGGTQVGAPVSVNGSGTYNPSTGFTPIATGTYWWYASYSGDTNNNPSSSACGSFMSSTTVKNDTTTTATGPASGTHRVAIAASAISSALSGATSGAGGTIAFKVFGPQSSAPTSCTSGGTTIGSAVTVSGNGTYHPSTSYTPASAGTYWWYATYAGDSNNSASNSTCGSGMASTTVS